MSAIKVNECGAYERDVEQNWAAAYAKRLVEKEALERDQAITGAVGLEAAAREEAIAEEEAARVAKDNALADGTALEDKCIYSRHIREGNITTGKIHDGDVTEVKLAKDSVTSEKIKDDAVIRTKLGSSATLMLYISNGNAEIKYENGVPIDAILAGTEVSSFEGKPIRDAAAQEWIDNIVIFGTDAPPIEPDGLTRLNDGMIYLQNHPEAIGYDVQKIFMLCGSTNLGTLNWKQIYPAFFEYSTTPQQIGVWIDGNPVYRVVVTQTLTESDFDKGFYQLTAGDLGVRILDEISVIVDSSFRHYEPKYSDSTQSENSVLGKDYSVTIHNTGYTLLIGYIDFVTLPSNIIS